MAYPFRAILSPIELDDPSSPALGLARSIAKDQGATLHLLYVVAMASAFGEPAISATLHSRAEEKAIQALNGIAANHLGKLCTGGCAERLAESGHGNRVQRMEVE
jgi:nucleotide-binding universal stress UspA family protein